MIIASSVRAENASREVGRKSTSALAMSPVTEGSPGKEFVKRLRHRFEEVRFPLAQERERLMRIANERPQDPRHLRADQSKHDYPDPENRPHPRITSAAPRRLQRTRRR